MTTSTLSDVAKDRRARAHDLLGELRELLHDIGGTSPAGPLSSPELRDADLSLVDAANHLERHYQTL